MSKFRIKSTCVPDPIGTSAFSGKFAAELCAEPICIGIAAECVRLARRAKTDNEKRLLLQMAESWRKWPIVRSNKSKKSRFAAPRARMELLP